MQITVTDRKTYSLVQINPQDAVLSPDQIPMVIEELKQMNIPLDKGVVVGGRIPQWLVSAVSLHFAPASFVGVYDPKLGSVVTKSLSRKVVVGAILG